MIDSNDNLATCGFFYSQIIVSIEKIHILYHPYFVQIV